MVSGEAEIKGRAADGTITIASGEAVYEAANPAYLHRFGNCHTSHSRIGGNGVLDKP